LVEIIIFQRLRRRFRKQRRR